MEKKEFCAAVAKRLGVICPNLCVDDREVLKNNTTLNGIILRDKDTKIAPTIYIDSMYEKEMSVDETANKVYEIYEEHKDDSVGFDVELFKDWEWVKSRLTLDVINTARNEKLLETAVHEEFLDLSILCRILVESKGDTNAYITVLTNHLDQWGVTAEEVLQVAKEQTPILLPASLRKISDVLDEMMPGMEGCFDMPEIPLLVLSNEQRIHGAATMFYPNKLQEIYESVGTFALLPSSIHEVLIHPTEDKSALPGLTCLVNEVNSTEVSEEDFLSDHAYFYDGTKLSF